MEKTYTQGERNHDCNVHLVLGILLGFFLAVAILVIGANVYY